MSDDPGRQDDPPPPTEEERRQRNSYRRQAARLSAVGIQFAVSIAVGALGGMWLDNKLGTEPWLLVTGIILGAVAAFRDLIQMAKKTKFD